MFRLYLMGCVLFFCVVITEQNGQAQSVSEYAVQVSATVQTSPAQITLSWPGDTNAIYYGVYRKNLTDTSWTKLLVSVFGAAASSFTSYTDTNVVVGGTYEYAILKSFTNGAGVIVGNGAGYIYAGIQVPLVENRGKLILIVDNTMSSSLVNELSQLQQDLEGDGWQVIRHDVPRSVVDPASFSSDPPTEAQIGASRAAEISVVKALIQADYNADPSNVQAVFLFGHIPVPYSGDLNPDQHTDHQGAWPADAYYGDMTDSWTDSSVNITSASDQRNWNVPGDGKFDKTGGDATGSNDILHVQLQVGRVDLSNLPSFSLPEVELLRRYLNKDHAYRNRLFTVSNKGLINDNFGLFGGEAFASYGWRNFSTFFGINNIITGSWLLNTPNPSNSYIWGYACGGGTYTDAAGVTSTSQLASSDPPIVFTMLLGSYFGDWDSQDNLLRATIATPTYTLTSAWVGRPGWEFHHMALGGTIGYDTLVSQNNYNLYNSGLNMNYVHVALMGDPSLRMFPVVPAANLTATNNGFGGVTINWRASSDTVNTVIGYNLYSAATSAGPFTRLNSSIIMGTTYTDYPTANVVYMVRAVTLQTSASGTYYDASEGVFYNYTYGTPLVNYGDANGDGKVDMSDAVQVAKAVINLVTLTPAELQNAEVDGGKSLTLTDAVLIAKYVVGLCNSLSANTVCTGS